MPSPPPRQTRRTRRRSIRLTSREYVLLGRKAAAVGLPVSVYVRQVALGRPLHPRRRFQEMAAAAQIARIANNLRQLQRIARLVDDGALLSDLDFTIETLRDLLDVLARPEA